MTFALKSGFVGNFGLALLLSSAIASAQVSPAQEPFRESARNAPVNKVQWEKVVSLDFSDPAELEKLTVVDGRWEIKDGKLWAVEGDGNRSIFLAHPQSDNLRVEFEATNFADENGLIGDITLLLNAIPARSVIVNGYALTTGSYYNTCTTFYKEAKKLANTEYSPVVSGQVNRVVIELYNGHIRYWMNDEILLEAWDLEPLKLDGTKWIGLRTYATQMSVDNFVISHPAK